MTKDLPKALITWSSGKDSAWALHVARQSGDLDIVGALTTVTDTFARVSMHGVREELLAAQLEAAGLPGVTVRIPYPCTNDIYEREMAKAMQAAKADGVTHVIFGDLFLADLRAWREEKLKAIGMTAVFSIWMRPTDELAREMIAAGVEAHLAVVDLKKLPASFAGRRFDGALLGALPEGIDPCGENGEFHSFVSAGRCSSEVFPCASARRSSAMDLLSRIWWRPSYLRWGACHKLRSFPRRRESRSLAKALGPRLRGDERSKAQNLRFSRVIRRRCVC